MQRSAVPVEGVQFTDRYGETRTIHHNQSPGGPLRVKRVGTTPALALNRPVAERLGTRVKELRVARGWSMTELAERSGLRGDKQTIYAIETAMRGQGVRLGTLYALAMAFDVEAADLLPAVSDVTSVAQPRATVRTSVELVRKSA